MLIGRGGTARYRCSVAEADAHVEKGGGSQIPTRVALSGTCYRRRLVIEILDFSG